MRHAILSASACFLLACGETTGPPSSEIYIDVRNPRSTLEVGDSVRFEAIVGDRMSDGHPTVPVRWTSSHAAVVSIDSTGLAVAQGRGYSTVSASIDDSTRVSWSVHVIWIAALKIDPDSVLLFPWDRASVHVTPVDSFGDQAYGWEALASERGESVVWSLDDTVAARLGGGPGWPSVVGLAEGRTTLRARLLGRTATAGVIVRPLEFTQVAAGDGRACAIATDSLPYCWGPWFGLFGPESYLDPEFAWPRFVPHRVAGSPKLVALSASDVACGVTLDGVAFCWGPNWYGQLGIGNTDSRIGAVPVSGNLRFSNISGGCGVTPDGAAYCWGSWPWGNAPEQCPGLGWFTPPYQVPCSRKPARLGGDSVAFASISKADSLLCGLDRDGHAYCWLPHSATRTLIDSSLTFTTLASAANFSCALAPSGSAYCWGSNVHGTLGIGRADQPTGVVAVAGGLRFSSLSAGGSHACGVAADGVAYCWGQNQYGEVGIPPGADATVPTAIATAIRFRSVQAGNTVTCGMSVDAVVYCWGWNYLGALGTPDDNDRWTPTPVVGQRP